MTLPEIHGAVTNGSHGGTALPVPNPSLPPCSCAASIMCTHTTIPTRPLPEPQEFPPELTDKQVTQKTWHWTLFVLYYNRP